MLKNNYLSVLQFQLKLNVKSDYSHDYLIVDEGYLKQMDSCLNTINELHPDIIIFPETAYYSKYDEFFLNLSKEDILIVFGSTYIGHINHTIVFHNGELFKIQKRFACGSEPMVRYTEKISVEEFTEKHLEEHTFYVKGNKIYILNCLEYYEAAYAIARTPCLSSDLFGFIVPCYNSNPSVFMDESKAIHNHNEFIYSFVTNRVKGKEFKGYGRSYVYGPIQYHEKDWLAQEGVISDKHNASILELDKDTPSFAYGKYACGKALSRFGRSDCYINTPKNIIVKNLF